MLNFKLDDELQEKIKSGVDYLATQRNLNANNQK